ncbi:proteasome regulatory particle lid subunit RPN9 KNAG_0C03190 [Huiozyma naganishii CBS 8797]|uniref:PCI domain-containing protein n=1 Tax=Huiozyma naganishii (strain ATCC MYA-139 / BCRC 22969 / CBS 8797 / KCTC 17520 / NBRC 10181 / NCYC 3082 / Yp74L-3) TaxID=1071383 RepID=J7S4R5_HUIN7|nr:hypothetical protein KNAG_0C03190 [Kazachstania naganishii CBS 8797]CCK69429.1 hypothetical protein KNAG_0C03190 [Kazachstania naganishii CBS 8797]
MSNHEIDTVLAELSGQCPAEARPVFEQFESLYEAKLWHQLTLVLKQFFAEDASAGLRLKLYDVFVSRFIDKVNQLDVVDFLLAALAEDGRDSLNYLSQLRERFTVLDKEMEQSRNSGLSDHRDAQLLIDLETCRVHLLRGELAQGKDLLNELEPTIMSLRDHSKRKLPLRIMNSFYSVNSLYFKRKEDFNSFYSNSLLYLSTLESDATSASARQQEGSESLAYDLAIAALLGDKVYNFAELLNNPVMDSLRGKDKYAWLLQMLQSLTQGDFDKFNESISKQMQQVPVLAANETFLRQKICLMTLVESIFSSSVRVLTFSAIAEATHLDVNDVEHLVMKSISLGLLKGVIDQVSQVVTVTWVQPRIINADQIAKMRDRLVNWQEQVATLSTEIEKNGKPIWV